MEFIIGLISNNILSVCEGEFLNIRKFAIATLILSFIIVGLNQLSPVDHPLISDYGPMTSEKFESLSQTDSDGPLIWAITGHAIIDYCYSLPSNYTFYATVNDTSGVDTVLVTVNEVEYEMAHRPSSDDSDCYIYVHSIPDVDHYTMYYSYWANDTLGFSSETDLGFCDMAVWNICPSETTTTTTSTNSTVTNEIGPEFLFMICSISVFVVLLLVLLHKVKKSR